jgi:hypothetical protein
MTVPHKPNERTYLLRRLLAGQEQQNALLEAVLNQLTNNQRNAVHWQRSHPYLAAACREAADALAKVYAAHMLEMAEGVVNNSESLNESAFARNEFVDSFGPRTAHLNGLLQVFCQLGGTAGTSTVATKEEK